MANPQPDQFTKLSNEILDEICRYKFNGAQFRIIIKVWRLTYGYNRKDHEFSNSFLQMTTGLSEATVKREISVLIKSKVLRVTKKATNTDARKVAFNKDYEQWNIPKSGDYMDEEIDLFSLSGVSDPTPQGNEFGVSDMNPPEVSDPIPQDIVLGYQIRSPYKERRSLKKSIKEKEQMFENFYSLYPRKVNKTYAHKTWLKHCKDDQFDPDLVMINTQHFIDTCTLLKTKPTFVPHASTYLNQRRYEDYPRVDPEGAAATSESQFERDKDELQRMMREAEERERNRSNQTLLDHQD